MSVSQYSLNINSLDLSNYSVAIKQRIGKIWPLSIFQRDFNFSRKINLLDLINLEGYLSIIFLIFHI